MKILLITNNNFLIKDRSIYTDANTSYIIERFSYLGKIKICGVEYSQTATMKLIKLNSIDSENITFIKKARMFSDKKTLKIIEDNVKKCDLVIGYQSPCVNAEAALKYAKKYNKKYLSLVVACAWDGFWNHGVIGKICAPYRYMSLRHVVKESNYALYVTNEFLQHRYPNYGINIGASNVEIIMNDDIILEKRLKKIQSFNSNSIIKLFTVASLNVRYKGQQYVIKALAKLKKQGITNFHYYLAGIGSKDFLEQLAKKYDVEEYVHILGSISHEKVFQYMDEMDAYIQPSLQEGLPRSLVEAMSRGLLCIGARTAGIPELLDSNYIVKQRSIDDIIKQMTSINKENLQTQAIQNYNKAKLYSKVELDKKRTKFFDQIKIDLHNNN